MTKAHRGRQLLEELKCRKNKEEWLFAIAIVKAGLEQEGNLDASAEHELAEALVECDISPDELERYLEKNRSKLLQFLNPGE